MIDAVASTIVEVVSDPIWAYVMTGVVGVAGIGGTLWQANRARTAEARNLQTSINAENERARLDEKRRIYARFLAACEDVKTPLPAAEWLEKLAGTGADTSQLQPKVWEYVVASTALLGAVSEVHLIGPAEVIRLADRLMRVLARYVTNDEQAHDEYREIRTRLVWAMRVDLGESVPEKVRTIGTPASNPG